MPGTPVSRHVNRIVLGTAQFGLDYGIANRAGRLSDDQACSILDAARAAGIDALDTAPVYGDAEQRLGDLGVGGWRIITKIPPLPEGCADATDWLIQTVEGSLRRLRVSRVAAVLLHRSQDLIESQSDQLYRGLVAIKRGGLAQQIGVSIYGPDQLDALDGRYSLDIVQAPLNVVDRRLVESGWLDRLAATGVEVDARSVFLQGLLLMNAESRPRYFERWSSLWLRWHEWLRSTGLRPVDACLRYALSFPTIARVVVGVDSLEQLRDVLGASRGALPALPDLGPADPDLVDPSRWRTL